MIDLLIESVSWMDCKRNQTLMNFGVNPFKPGDFY